MSRINDFNNRLENPYTFASHNYDAIVVIALASLSAGSQDPADYVSHMRAVTRNGTQCRSYAECAAFLTDDDTTNDNIDYEGLSGPIQFFTNGDIGSGCYSVYTHDAVGGRTAQFFSVPELTEITPSP